MSRGWKLAAMGAVLSAAVGCPAEEPSKSAADAQGEDKVEAPAGKTYSDEDRAKLATTAGQAFGALPADMATSEHPITPEAVALGKALYFDTRLSKNHDISCNSCHGLSTFGVDNEPTSPGHKGERGDRNSPTVYNAALQFRQFWDGREPTVERQAVGPVTNPVEMAMPDPDYVKTVLDSIPGYADLFAAAFPGVDDPITLDHAGEAIGAFERTLVTPSPFDAFVNGDHAALTDAQLEGLETFIAVGCTTCHNGPLLGGRSYEKLGKVIPVESEDQGRHAVTGEEGDRLMFKVPQLRNIVQTGPYLHDGSIADLGEMVRFMGKHQLGKELEDAQVESIVAFLGSLTGEIDADVAAAPELPESGPDTPEPDPS